MRAGSWNVIERSAWEQRKAIWEALKKYGPETSEKCVKGLDSSMSALYHDLVAKLGFREEEKKHWEE